MAAASGSGRVWPSQLSLARRRAWREEPNQTQALQRKATAGNEWAHRFNSHSPPRPTHCHALGGADDLESLSDVFAAEKKTAAPIAVCSAADSEPSGLGLAHSPQGGQPRYSHYLQCTSRKSCARLRPISLRRSFTPARRCARMCLGLPVSVGRRVASHPDFCAVGVGGSRTIG
jgi:hypothetical protein